MSTVTPLVTEPPAAERAGADLRAARERLGLSLQDVALHLRIRIPHLEALEEGRVSLLPGTAYALAFVRTYANALGLDAEEMVRRFKTEASEFGRQTELVFPVPMPERGLPPGAVVLLGLVLAIGAYAGWYRLSGEGRLPAETVTAIPEHLAPLAEQALPRPAGLAPTGADPTGTAPSGPALAGATGSGPVLAVPAWLVPAWRVPLSPVQEWLVRAWVVRRWLVRAHRVRRSRILGRRVRLRAVRPHLVRGAVVWLSLGTSWPGRSRQARCQQRVRSSSHPALLARGLCWPTLRRCNRWQVLRRRSRRSHRLRPRPHRYLPVPPTERPLGRAWYQRQLRSPLPPLRPTQAALCCEPARMPGCW